MDFGVGDIIKGVETGYGIYANEQNYRLQKKQFEYQKKLQQQIFDREDNAVQRRMADLQAAGMNPLLAAGGAAGTGQAVTVSAPQRGQLGSSYADYMLAKAKADADVSMTKAQQELLNEQATGASLNNALIRKQLKWYDDHPEFAPGVESGVYTGKGISSGIDAFLDGVSSSRLGQAAAWVGDKIGHSMRSEPKRDYWKAYNYYIDTGLSPKEADRRAKKFVAKN